MRIRRKKKPYKWTIEKKITVAVVCAIFAGVIAGTAGANLTLLPGLGLSLRIESFIAGFDASHINQYEVFKEALFKYGRIVFILWILGFLPVGGIINLCVLFAKGAGYGFTTALLVRSYGFTGLFYCVQLYLVQNVVLIPVFLFIAYSSIRFILDSMNKKSHITEYAFTLCIGFASVALASLFEAYVALGILQF